MLRGEKALLGYGMWQQGNRDGCHQWSRAVEFLGESRGARLEVKAYSQHETLKFRILLNEQRCIWRLDFADDGHVNPLSAPESPGQPVRCPGACETLESCRRIFRASRQRFAGSVMR